MLYLKLEGFLFLLYDQLAVLVSQGNRLARYEDEAPFVIVGVHVPVAKDN